MQQSTLPALISPKSPSHLALLSLTPRVCDQRYRFRSGNRAAKSDAAGGRVRRRSSVRLGVRHRDKARLATKPVATCHSAPSSFFKKKADGVELRGRTPKLKQNTTKKNATASFSCLPSFFINSAAGAGGRPGGGRLETASHVTEQSKGMYLKVSSRLATSTAHRPHLPAAAQRSKQAWIRTKPLITSLPLLRLFGTAAKPAASAAAAHTGESHTRAHARESLQDCFHNPVSPPKKNEDNKENRYCLCVARFRHIRCTHVY